MYDLTEASNERHARFVARVVEHGEVWVLAHRDEEASWATSSCAALDENDEQIQMPIVPFWSDRAYAQRCAKDLWVEYVPRAIPLDVFFEFVLRDMHEKDVLVGTNWNGDLVGRDIEAMALAQELFVALEAAGLVVDDDDDDARDDEENDEAAHEHLDDTQPRKELDS